ncbi:MAG: hypothetical protein QW412_02820 [Candidatus Aenigmatarchaeota archaeon]
MAKIKKMKDVSKKIGWKTVFFPLLLLLLLVSLIVFFYFQTQNLEMNSEDALRFVNQKIAKCGISFEDIDKDFIFIDEAFFNFLRKTCVGIESYIQPNTTLELWQASRVWKKEPEGCDVSLPHCKVYYIFGLVGKKGEFSCVYIQVDNKKLEIEEFCELEARVNLLVKDSYKQGEEVEFKVINRLESPIYIDFYDWDDRFLYFYKNGEWVEQEIKVYCLCPCDCLACPACGGKAKLCDEIGPLGVFTYVWDQKVYESKTINCTSGNITFSKNCYEAKIAEKGKYKVMFCYSTSYRGNVNYPGCEVVGKVRCLEKEFEIK